MRTEIKIGIGVGLVLAVGLIVYFVGVGQDDAQPDAEEITRGSSDEMQIEPIDQQDQDQDDLYGGFFDDLDDPADPLADDDADEQGDSLAATQPDEEEPTLFLGGWGDLPDEGDESAGPGSADPWGDLSRGTSTAPTTTGSDRTYTVKQGDSLWKIAEKYYGSGAKLDLIAKANPGIDPDRLSLGTELKIPPAPEAPAATLTDDLTSSSASREVEGKRHVVKSGDNLWDIAASYYGSGAKLNLIREANPGLGETLKIGQVLVIPDAPAGGRSSSGASVSTDDRGSSPSGGSSTFPRRQPIFD